MNRDTLHRGEAVATLFTRHATALSSVDLDEIANCYAYPSLAVTRMGTQAITDPEMTRRFFADNCNHYCEAGLKAVRIRNLRPSYDRDGLRVGLADRENLDAGGVHVGTELNAYHLIRRSDRWMIAVTSPLDARS